MLQVTENNHVFEVFVKTVNFTRAKDLNHCQFNKLLNDEGLSN